MDKFLRKITHSEFYQGNGKIPNKYFEGWYFKHESENIVIALIPGISYDGNDSHAFIQLIASINNAQHVTKYFRFPINKFFASKDKLEITIDKNKFTPYGIEINITQDDYVLKGKLTYGHFTPLQTTFLQPNIMGIFAYLPNLDCNHGILSMRHTINGSFTLNNIPYPIYKGIGYVEKDWGKSFPGKYMWVQCGNFDLQNISFMMSYAKLKILGLPLNGLICVLKIADKELVFATYNFATLKILFQTPTSINLVIKKSSYKLFIKATAPNSGNLLAPTTGKMSRSINESISCVVSLKLTHHNKTILDCNGTHGGLELNL